MTASDQLRTFDHEIIPEASVTPGFMSPPATPCRKSQLKRYQTEFVERIQRLPSNISSQDRLWLEARAANALRQMGSFRDAELMRKKAIEILEYDADKGGWEKYLNQLMNVIARKDDSAEPLDMIPDSQVAFACADKNIQSSFDKTICAKPEVVARVIELQQSRKGTKVVQRQ